MLGKLLLTVVVAVLAYVAVAKRREEPSPDAHRSHILSKQLLWLRRGAVILVVCAGAWLAIATYQRWQHANQIVTVQVVNVYTGKIVEYRAQRRDVDGGRFRTLDGREVAVATTERVVLVPMAER